MFLVFMLRYHCVPIYESSRIFHLVLLAYRFHTQKNENHVNYFNWFCLGIS